MRNNYCFSQFFLFLWEARNPAEAENTIRNDKQLPDELSIFHFVFPHSEVYVDPNLGSGLTFLHCNPYCIFELRSTLFTLIHAMIQNFVNCVDLIPLT